jgi:hypothetical protein
MLLDASDFTLNSYPAQLVPQRISGLNSGFFAGN